jgi:DNA-binding transcriptional ArsR family regulator
MSSAVIALADPSRRAIFESLTGGEAAVKGLTARFDISQPAISQHLGPPSWMGRDGPHGRSKHSISGFL